MVKSTHFGGQNECRLPAIINIVVQDGFWVVVESGLSEGDVIVVESAGGAPE